MDTTNSHYLVTKIISVAILICSFILNIIIISIILKIGYLQTSKKLKTGLKLVLAVAFFDLLGPIVGLVQEAMNYFMSTNILTYDVPCQFLGIFHTLIPYTSPNLIALISYERFCFIFSKPIQGRYLILSGILHFILGFLPSVISAWNSEFKVNSSFLICNTSNVKSIPRTCFKFIFVISLTANTLIIIYSYTSILILRYRTKIATKSKVLNQELQGNSSRKYSNENDNYEENERLSSDLNSNADISFESSTSVISHDNYSRKSTQTDRFTIRVGLIILAYSIILFPCTFLHIYQVLSGDRLDPVFASISVILFLSLNLINPLLLVVLHTSISEVFVNSVKDIFDSIFRK